MQIRADTGGLMRSWTVHPRIWLLACMWCLLVWTTSAKASWEAHQQAGEEAYSRGDYNTARRMFLAAVREARHFGPQDPRLDISLTNWPFCTRCEVSIVGVGAIPNAWS